MAWYHMIGASADTVISTRVELARNLIGHKFPTRIDTAEANELIEQFSPCMECLEMRKIHFSEISAVMATSYAERHYIDSAMIGSELPRALFLQESDGIAVTVGASDHLHIRCILPGLALTEAYRSAFETEHRLDAEFDFAYEETLGYLTQSPADLGTGMHVTALLFLPALTKKRCMSALADQLAQSGCSVLGMFGEGIGGTGSLYQISNRITLGISENEILHRFHRTIVQISEFERTMRQTIIEEAKDALMDQVQRSVGILKYAHLLSVRELIRLSADVRLGISMGWISDLSYEQLNTLLTETMPATLTLSAENQPRSETARDKLRAERARSIFTSAAS